jgi:hypothetical protein
MKGNKGLIEVVPDILAKDVDDQFLVSASGQVQDDMLAVGHREEDHVFDGCRRALSLPAVCCRNFVGDHLEDGVQTAVVKFLFKVNGISIQIV